MEWLEVFRQVAEMIGLVVGLVGGGVGAYFWRENKALKKAEVDEKEAQTMGQQQQTWAKQYEEYQEYIRLLKEDNKELRDENKKKEAVIEEMRSTLADVVKRVGSLENQVERAEYWRCDKIDCSLRVNNKRN